MMTENGEGPKVDPLEAILEPLHQERRRLQVSRDLVMEEVRLIDGEMRRIDRVLKAAGLEEVKSKAPKAVKAKKVSAESLRAAREQIRLHGDQAFTAGELAEWIGRHSSLGSALIRELRDAEFIRLIGTRSVEMGKAPYEYVLIEDGQAQ
jgi:hypothetical protein